MATLVATLGATLWRSTPLPRLRLRRSLSVRDVFGRLREGLRLRGDCVRLRRLFLPDLRSRGLRCLFLPDLRGDCADCADFMSASW